MKVACRCGIEVNGLIRRLLDSLLDGAGQRRG